MVELVDTLDLKSNGKKFPCGFKSRSEYRNPLYLIDLEGFLVLCVFFTLIFRQQLFKMFGAFK